MVGMTLHTCKGKERVVSLLGNKISLAEGVPT